MAALLDWLRLNRAWLALIVGLALVYFFLGSRPTAGVDSLAALDRTAGAGRPVVVEFYSNF